MSRVEEAKDLTVQHLNTTNAGGSQHQTTLFDILLAGIQKIGMRVAHSFQAFMSSMDTIVGVNSNEQDVAISHLAGLASLFILLSFAVSFLAIEIK